MGALGGNDDKDELKKHSSFQNYALALAMASKTETETFLPLPGFGLNDMARKMNSPFAAVRQITNIVTTLENFSYFAVGNKSGFYKKSGAHDGLHDKGDAKFVANFLKLVGYGGPGMDPIARVNSIKQLNNLH